MKIEVLFPECCNLFGDLSNMEYFRKCLVEDEFIDTALDEEPRFVSEDVDFIYLGPMTERTQEKIIKKFMPYKKRIAELIDKGTTFLFTGNAMEILGQYIIDDDGSKIEALGLFDFYAKRDLMHRHNSNFLGEFSGSEIMGFKTQFTMSYPVSGKSGNKKDVPEPFMTVKKGVGMNKKSKLEGIHRNNFYGTYIIGPILIMNPEFTKMLLKGMGASEKLAFEDEVIEAYRVKLDDFHRQG